MSYKKSLVVDCQCASWGYCPRRECIVPEAHWRKCQSGSGEVLDRLYRSVGTADRPGPRPAQQLLPPVSGIGTALAQIIRREMGSDLGCSACEAEMLRLDAMTSDEVRRERDEIVRGILTRGPGLLRWWSPKRWAAGALPAIARARLEQWVDEAVVVGGEPLTGPSSLQESSPPSRSIVPDIALSVTVLSDTATDCRGEDAFNHHASGNGHVHNSGQASRRARLVPENAELARGIMPHVPRAEVLRARRTWHAQGFELPPLELPETWQGTMRNRLGAGLLADVFQPGCIYLGGRQGALGCSCGGKAKVVVHACRHEEGPELCCMTDTDLRQIREPGRREEIASCESCELRDGLPRFITQAQLVRDVTHLVSLIPPEVTTVAGVARSGVPVAGLVAMLLHLPLDIVRQDQGDIVSAGHGWRFSKGRPERDGTVLVVDDTCMTGNSLKAFRPVARKHYAGRKILYASVYVNPRAALQPDLWAVDLPWPHLLEWNLFNSVLLASAAFDLDGILCEDFSPEDDDDGHRYLAALENARPKYLVRRGPIPLIVTARLEKYREPTMAWLTRWGIEVQRFEMGPWKTIQERRRGDVVAFKAEHYERFRQLPVRPGPHLFIESDSRQARGIAQLTKGVVVCPEAGRCFQG